MRNSFFQLDKNEGICYAMNMGTVPKVYIGYAVFGLTAAICLTIGAFCVAIAIKLIRRQMKLHHSIRLVELKSVKFHFFIFMALDFGCAMFAMLALLGGYPKEYAVLERAYGLTGYLATTCVVCVLLLLVTIGFLLVVLFVAKSAVVDKGVYTASNYLDWYHVHDYIIDEDAGKVTLSTCRETFGTIRGTTSPLKVTKNDIPKLKFILNKNKNKFSV